MSERSLSKVVSAIRTVISSDREIGFAIPIHDQVDAARLPQHMYEDSYIYQMEEGEVGITVPWAMSVSVDGRCFLKPHYTIKRLNERGGTLQMAIGRSKDGFEVGIPRGYKYDAAEVDENRLIPVFRLYEAPWER